MTMQSDDQIQVDGQVGQVSGGAEQLRSDRSDLSVGSTANGGPNGESGESGHADLAEIQKFNPERLTSPSERAARRTDADLLEQFIRERCSRSEHTQNSYRAQLRRLGWFCRFKFMRSVREFSRESWPVFQAYLRNPPREHVMLASVAFGHPSWAPFRGALSEASAKQAEIVARSFFSWLADPAIGAMHINPVASIRTHSLRRSATRASIERFLNEQDWSYVVRSIAIKPESTTELRRIKARARWVVDLAVLTGLRASEIAAATAAMIRPSQPAGTYALFITRKGGIESAIPLIGEVLSSYSAYMRLYEGTWVAAEPKAFLPLVLPARIKTTRKSADISAQGRSHIWRIFKDVMLEASDLAASEGEEACAERLSSASTHWLRHTFGTRLLDAGADIRSVRDLMDHASISTTNQYLHRPQEKLRADIELLSASSLASTP
jgi:integrase/recombinase XerD